MADKARETPTTNRLATFLERRKRERQQGAGITPQPTSTRQTPPVPQQRQPMQDFAVPNMPNRQRGAPGSSAIGWESQPAEELPADALMPENVDRSIFYGLAPGRSGRGIGSMGKGQYVPTVGIVPNNPRNAQFAPQFRESAFNSRQMDLNSQMRNDAFMAGINQKRKVYGKFGQDQNATPFDIAANNQLIDNAVAANQQQVGRNFMSARDKAMISRPMGGQQEQRSGYGDTNPINGRGIEGFIPSGNMPDRLTSRQYADGARYQGNPNRNGISPDILVGRTATGGVSLVGERDLNSPGGMTDQSRAAAGQRRDARILGNRLKYGLSPETPAVAAATERSTMRNAPARAERQGIERMNQRRQAMEDLQDETTAEYFRSITDPRDRRSVIEKHLGGQAKTPSPPIRSSPMAPGRGYYFQ